MTEGHTHYWTVPAPDGPTTAATCACGSTRPAANSLPDLRQPWRRRVTAEEQAAMKAERDEHRHLFVEARVRRDLEASRFRNVGRS